MPEDSVRPETQTLIVLIRRKGFVGGFKIYLKIRKHTQNKTNKKTKQKNKE